MKVLNLTRLQAVDVFTALGSETADSWSIQRLVVRLQQLTEESPVTNNTEPEILEHLRRVQKANRIGVTIRVDGVGCITVPSQSFVESEKTMSAAISKKAKKTIKSPAKKTADSLTFKRRKVGGKTVKRTVYSLWKRHKSWKVDDFYKAVNGKAAKTTIRVWLSCWKHGRDLPIW